MNLICLFVFFSLNILFICCSVAAIEVIEDNETTEKEDLAKALAQRQTYFWRKMVEKWYCSEETLKADLKDYLELGSMDDVIEMCNEWRMMALAVDAFLMTRDEWRITTAIFGAVEKPIFVYNGKELHLSSAMTAIVLICQAFLLERGNRNYLREIQIDFVNKDKCDFVVQQNEGKFLGLNELTYEEGPNEKCYRLVLFSDAAFLQLQIKGRKEAVVVINYAMSKAKGDNFIDIIDFTSKLKEGAKWAHSYYESLWSVISEIGIDLNEICASAKAIDESLDDNKAVKLISNMRDYCVFERSIPKGVGKELGQLLKLYELKVHARMVAEHPKQMKDKSLEDPCEKAKLRVKKNAMDQDDQKKKKIMKNQRKSWEAKKTDRK